MRHSQWQMSGSGVKRSARLLSRNSHGLSPETPTVLLSKGTRRGLHRQNGATLLGW